MSEQILERPPTTAQAGGGLPGLDEAAPASSRKRIYLTIGSAVGAGLILGVVVLFLLPGRAAEEAAASAAVAEAAVAAEAAAVDAAEPEQAVPPTNRTRVRITSRDPFKPLVPEPPPAPAAPARDVSKADQPASGASSSSTAATISALSISGGGNSVKLKLDGEPYTVDVGETFAKTFRLYSIFDDNCAGFLYGDQNAVVCEGGSVSVG
jgi:hypothetical protein